jgi:hypothetical protein
MLHGVALVRTYVSEERTVVYSSPIQVTLMMEAIPFSETSVLTRAIRRRIQDGDSLKVLNISTNNATRAIDLKP